MKLKNLFLSSALILFGLALGGQAQAHNPRLVERQDALIESPIVITNPDISQAFYGRLKGWNEYYQVTFDSPQEFYFQILVPDVKDVSKDVSAILFRADNREIQAKLLPSDSLWPTFFEPFAGDNYFEGASSTVSLEAGTYLIKVSNPNNEGKYVLVVGRQEIFTAKETLNTIVNLPLLKIYFNKSPLTAYFNRIGLFLGGLLLAIIVLMVIVRLIVKRFRS